MIAEYAHRPNMISGYVTTSETVTLMNDSGNSFILNSPHIKLRDWINKDDLSHSMLCMNPNALHLFEDNYQHINWFCMSMNTNLKAIKIIEKNPTHVNLNYLSVNPNAMHILEKNFDRYRNPKIGSINWGTFSSNPAAIPYLEKYLYKINWDMLSLNPGAINLLTQNPKQINWTLFSRNPNPIAIKMLEENQEKIDWAYLSSNPNAMHLLEKNLDKIDWDYLSSNTHPNAIKMLEKNINRIDWNQLSKNPEAIHILEKNKSCINLYFLSRNPAIFEYNYQQMSIERTRIIFEELMKKALHPSRIQKMLDMGMDIFDF